MNKLQGFYALQKINLPTIPWLKYEEGVELDEDILWTIRCAVEEGEDLNLPRKIGVTAEEAHLFAMDLRKQLKSKDLILYYPYFIANKSGVLDVSKYRTVIEAVKDDLWNLVTENHTDVTMIFEEEDIKIKGDASFLSQAQLLELTDSCLSVKRNFRKEIEENKSVMLEWSYACQSDLKKNPIGEAKLVFYEIRTV